MHQKFGAGLTREEQNIRYRPHLLSCLVVITNEHEWFTPVVCSAQIALAGVQNECNLHFILSCTNGNIGKLL